MDIQQIKRQLTQRFETLYDSKESDNIANRLLEEITGKPYSQLFISEHKLTKKENDRLQNMAQRLEAGEPLQYVIGEVQFGGMILSVAPGVLIPRPETEEMCAIMKQKGLLESGHFAIDIGTGSGAISLYIAKHSKDIHVESIDISAAALHIATSNAQRNKLSDLVTFHQMDIITDDFSSLQTEYDLIVSNPPYVLNSEKKNMSKHVLGHEPTSALFVPDNDPLLFYRMILNKLLPLLRESGWIVFELNARTARQCVQLCKKKGLKTELIKDMQGRERFIFAQKTKAE